MEPASVRSGVRINVRVLHFMFVVCLCGGTATLAQTNDIWLGGNGYWSDPSLWSNGVPNGNFNVFIDNGNGANSAVTLDMSPSIVNLTIDSDDSLSVNVGQSLTVNGSSMSNAGQLLHSGTLYINAPGSWGNVTLSGTGTMAMQNGVITTNSSLGKDLVNQSTIAGWGNIGQANDNLEVGNDGTINANSAGHTLSLSAYWGFNNVATMEATNGGALTITDGGENTGTIQAVGSGSQVQFNGHQCVVWGLNGQGTLTTSDGGLIVSSSCVLGNLSNTGSLQVPSGQDTIIQGTITNTGSMQLLGHLLVRGNTTLSGSGSVTMQGGYIQGVNQTQTLSNQNTISGYGVIGDSFLSLINAGSISANDVNNALSLAANNVTNKKILEASNGALLALGTAVTNGATIQTVGAGSQVQSTLSLTNRKTLAPGKGGLINISGSFTNFSGTTLSAGTYRIAGTLQFKNANIATANYANITLIGPASQIIDQNGNDALANFSSNMSSTFALTQKKTISLSTNFSNSGTVNTAPGTSFRAATYTQTGGTTTVDGTLTAPGGSSIQRGNVFGKGGTIASAVVSSGSVTPGDSATKPGKLSMTAYTQNADGSLNIAIGGVNVGKQYGQLVVANGVSLDGTLNIELINGFVPALGNTFTILTGSTITGQFSTVNGLSINGGEHFQVAYNPGNVTLTVVSGAE